MGNTEMKVVKGGAAKKARSEKAAEARQPLKFTVGNFYDQSGIRSDIVSFSRMTLPGALSFRYAKLLTQLNTQFRESEDVRMKMIETIGVKDEKLGTFIPVEGHPGWVDSDEHRAKNAQWTKEWAELCAQEFTIDFEPIKSSEIARIDISPATLTNLIEFGIIVEG